MILCELLEACPLDPRVVRSQDAAIELVADVEPSVVAGFQWPLTVSASLSPPLMARLWRSTVRTARSDNGYEICCLYRSACPLARDTEGPLRFSACAGKRMMGLARISMALPLGEMPWMLSGALYSYEHTGMWLRSSWSCLGMSGPKYN